MIVKVLFEAEAPSVKAVKQDLIDAIQCFKREYPGSRWHEDPPGLGEDTHRLDESYYGTVTIRPNLPSI